MFTAGWLAFSFGDPSERAPPGVNGLIDGLEPNGKLIVIGVAS